MYNLIYTRIHAYIRTRTAYTIVIVCASEDACVCLCVEAS